MANRGRERGEATRTPGVSTDAILESISDGVFTVDDAWRITSFNRSAEVITGVPREQALGRRCSEVFRSSACEGRCALRDTIETGDPIVNRAAFIIDVRGHRVPISVSTAILRDERGEVVGGAETFRDLSEVEALRRELGDRRQVGDLVSRSPAMRPVFELIHAVAPSASTVLVCGETGTGKELVARAIHACSPRRDGPFVAVNCGALPDTLLESELFGYEPGAFTGARRAKPGRFALANGGTLFLDEVGEVSPALQVRLLRVLQERAYEPLGATRSRPTDVRVIAATNADLAALVRAGRFREDLYYRINVVRIEIPPLRSRKEDIPLLADHFVTRFDALERKDVEGLDDEALAVLMAYDWPGNVRELENAIEHAFVLLSAGRIAPRHLPADLVPRLPARASGGRLAAARDAVESQAILAALARNGNNRTAAARELGVHKSTLLRRMARLGVALPATDGRHRGTDAELRR